MIWLFERGDRVVQLVTRFDASSGEYVLDMQWSDGLSETERFRDYVKFKTRIVDLGTTSPPKSGNRPATRRRSSRRLVETVNIWLLLPSPRISPAGARQSTYDLDSDARSASAVRLPRNPPRQPPYDLVIAGGSVIDGDGTPAVTADIGIREGKVATSAI